MKAILVSLMIIIFGLLVYIFRDQLAFKQNAPAITETKAEEIEKIKVTPNLDAQVELYRKLINRVGPEQAQELLLKSGLPFDGQTHLLNHTVGDFLYDKYKTEGLVYCKDYFLSSCYHGFVIRAVADGGIANLEKVMYSCKKGGYGVVAQCSHAIGHGFLANEGYQFLTKALEKCDEISTKVSEFPTFNCYDGVFMENIWAVHDDGQPSPFRWVKDDDPVYPCNNPKIDQKYIKACWSNQPSWMFKLYKGDFKKVAEQCNKLTNSEFKSTCFDAIARQIHPSAKGQVPEVIRMCNLMPGEWVDPCLISVANAEFSVGGRDLPFKICDGTKPEKQNSCYSALIGPIKGYSKNTQEKNEMCNKIPVQEVRSSCLTL